MTRADTGERSDTQLMMAVRDGDLEQLETLFRRHYASVHALCARLADGAHVAEDLAQEAFLRVLRLRRSYRGESRFSTWLYRIARNVCVDHGVAAARHRRLETAWSLEGDVRREEAQTSDTEAEGEERRGRLARALDRLPAEQREAIVLARFHGLPYEEIGLVLGCTAGAARVRVHRALRRLRDVYLELEHQER